VGRDSGKRESGDESGRVMSSQEWHGGVSRLYSRATVVPRAPAVGSPAISVADPEERPPGRYFFPREGPFPLAGSRKRAGPIHAVVPAGDFL
jgi:hypothetical protein